MTRRLEMVAADPEASCRFDALTDPEGILMPHLPSLQRFMYGFFPSNHIHVTDAVDDSS